MSKKPTIGSPPPSAAAGDAGAAPKLLCPARVSLAEAMTRFAPFIFTVDTDTKETVELKPTIAALLRDPAFTGSMFTVDRIEAANFVATLTDPAYSALIADVKTQLPQIVEGGGDPAVVAQCIRCRIASFAIEREEARVDEVEAVAARHAELVARLMEDGLTASEAEKAANEEEEASSAPAQGGGGGEGGDDDEDRGPARSQAFVLVRGFPTSPAEMVLLSTLQVPLDALLIVNSSARLGRREEAVAADPKAAGKGGVAAKKPAEAKKPDAKKAAGGKGGKGGPADDGVLVPPEPLSLMLAKERSKIPVFDTAHPLRHTAVWTYNVATAESKSGAIDEATGLRIHDLLESEAEVAEKVINETIRLELAVYEYRQWSTLKRPKVVAKLHVPSAATHGAAGDASADDISQREAAEAKAAAEAAAKEAAAKAAAAAAAAAKKPDPKKGASKTAAAEEAAATPEAPPMPQSPPLPTSVAEIPTNNELYQRLLDEVTSGNTSLEVRLHCVLEQINDTAAAAAAAAAAQDSNKTAGPTSAQSIADTIAQKTKRDVADFCDFVLAQLDGTQEQVFEAARKRRLKAAEAVEPNAASGADDDDGPIVPLADATYLRLLPAVQSTVEPDSLLLGVPLRKVEGRVKRFVHDGARNHPGTQSIRVDSPSLRSMELAGSLLRHVLVDRFGVTDAEAVDILSRRTHAALHSAASFADRLAELQLTDQGDSTTVKASCADGSHVLVTGVHVPTERVRYFMTWSAFHGRVPLPQWLEWREFVRSEELFFNPPPRDDDDVDEPEAAAAADEEEDEEEEEIGVDEDGEPIMRKKPRKVVIFPPEYTHRDVTVLEELRRRSTHEQFKRRVAIGGEPDEVLLADNHTASTALSERTVLYPSDGATVVAESGYANQHVVNATVYHDSGVLFGTRSAVASSGSSEASRMLAGAEPVVPTLDLASGAALDKKSPKSSPRGAAAVAASAVTPAPAAGTVSVEPVPDTSAQAASTSGGSSKAGGATPSGVSTLVVLRDDALLHITVAAVSGGAGGDASATVGGNATPGPRDPAAVSQSQPPLRTTLRCSLPGSTATFDAVSGAVQLVPEAPRETPITVFNPLTRQVARIVVSETARTVLLDGTVLCRYADGSRMNMFANGNTAVLHEGHWLITNSSGKRVLKLPNGTVTPLVVSLVTTNTDTETLSRLTTREDGVVTVGYDDGKQLVQHIDGTRLWQDASRSVVEIESDGFPRIYAVRPNAAPGSMDTHGRLTLRSLGELSITMIPNRRVSVSHLASGLAAALDVNRALLFIEPSPTKQTRYVVDCALGGMRIADGAFGFHITPFGRTAARPLAEDLPVQPTTEPGVKQVIDVFMRPEVVNPAFVQARAAAEPSWDMNQALHMLPVIPEFTEMGADGNAAGFAAPPRSRQQREKQSACIAAIKNVLPPQSPPTSIVSKSGLREPVLFICGGGGVVLELMRRVDAEVLVALASHRSNLLFTDVHVEPMAIMHDAQSEGGDAAVPATNATAVGPYVNSVILSTAAQKLQNRSGVPKILVDLRRASAHSGPISVSQFLQDLKQGPLTSSKTSSSTHDDAVQGGCVTVTTRHLVTLNPAAWVSGRGTAGPALTAQTPLPEVAAGDPCYERALLHLARAIPPIIAAQLALLPGQRSLGTTMRGRRTNTGGSRGRSSEKARSAPDTKPSQDDPEFAQQMAAIEQREKAKRKEWPTPILDRRAQIEMTRGASFGKYWAAPEGAQRVASLQTENEKYKAKSGYEKVPVPMYAPPPAPAPAPAPQAPTSSANAAPLQPTPPRPQQQQPNNLRSSSSSNTGRKGATTKHVSPTAPVLMTSLPGAATATGLNLVRALPAFTASPPSLHFGNVVGGHRYTMDVLLRNVGDVAARYSVLVSPRSAAEFIVVTVQHVPLAPGMAVTATVELNGKQPVGFFTANIVAAAEGGALEIPLRVETAADSGRGSAGQPRPGVKILGPTLAATFAPGTTRKAKSVAPRAVDSDED